MWGVRFTPSCLGCYCAAGDRRLRVYVDGAAYPGDPTTLPLASHQEIVVAFGTTAPQLPSPFRPPTGSLPACSGTSALAGSGVVTGTRIR